MKEQSVVLLLHYTHGWLGRLFYYIVLSSDLFFHYLNYRQLPAIKRATSDSFGAGRIGARLS